MLTPRQSRLAQELASDPAYATGKRSFPGTVTADDAVAIAADIHDDLDGATAARAEAARQAGRSLACGPGCSGCCEELVMVYLPEALRVARWLELPDNAAVKRGFLDAYAAWKQRVGDGPARLAEAFASGDEARHDAVHVELWRKRILCAFNQGGMCTIYPVRPVLCRDAHAVETSAYCYGDNLSGTVSIRLRSDELDEFLATSRRTLCAANNAIGGPVTGPTSLCVSVYELLTRGEQQGSSQE